MSLSERTCCFCAQRFLGSGPQQFCSIKCILDSKIDIRGDDECWPWNGRFFKNGYGALKFRNKYFRVSRSAYEIYCGIIPEGLEVMHSCDNKWCCNYKSHLSVGSHAQNMKDTATRGISSRGSHRPNAKLNENIVRIIRSMPLEIITRTDVARLLGLSFNTISYAVQGINWRYVS